MPPYRRRAVPACNAFDVLAVDVNERDQNGGNAQELSSQTREGIQPIFCRCIEEARIVERSEPDGARQCLLVGQEGNEEKRIPTLKSTVTRWRSYSYDEGTLQESQQKPA
jgi:hypothetical protein